MERPITMETLQARLMEADRQTEREGVVWLTLRRLSAELRRLNVDYAVIGGIALQHHGIMRSTQDVNVLVSADDLKSIHDNLIDHGYQRKPPTGRHIRDDVTRIRVEFLVSGEFPGDGLPKSVSFPKPESVAEESDEGLRFINLKSLIELKLASAKSAPHRIKDRADVLELIHHHHLTDTIRKQPRPLRPA